VKPVRVLTAGTRDSKLDSKRFKTRIARERGERTMLCSYSKLDPKNLEEIKALEKEIGATLLSFTCQDISPARIDETTLGKIKQLESRLGVALVAVRAYLRFSARNALNVLC
jgi:copper homeostasis protein CutC